MKKIVTLLTSITVLSSLATNASPLKGTKPNIILVMTDDQGMGDLSVMGNKILKTPYIDAFSKQSTRFRDFQVSPTCAPTRAAMMSGRFPFKVGITHTILQRERMNPSITTFPQVLQSAGYKTGLFGKWHLGDGKEYLPQARGFNEVLMHGAGGIGQTPFGDFPPNQKNRYFDNYLLHNETVVKTEGFCTDVFFAAASKWIKKQEQTNDPYFAYISLNAPHGPMFAPEKYKKRFLEAGYDKSSAARYGMIENIDDNFGELLANLKQWNALENTIVIFMTDNGMSMAPIKINKKKIMPFNAGMKGRKNTPHEGGTHVPMFLSWDKLTEKDVDITALCAHIDFFKTFTELAGAELPKEMQELDGRSLVPLLTDKNSEWTDRTLFFHCGRWKAGDIKKHKYTKCAVRTAKWRFVNNTELYNIQSDPNETTEISNKHPEVVKELQASYEKWWQESLPLMVNENLPKVTVHPFHKRYEKAKAKGEIPTLK